MRTSHNPPSRQFLDACDRLGMLVIDEAFNQWQRPKNPQDYHLYFDTSWQQDIDAMVLRDRNHPCCTFTTQWQSDWRRNNFNIIPQSVDIMSSFSHLSPHTPLTATFTVPYQPGVLVAYGLWTGK